MKTKITGLLTFLIGTFFFYSCDTDVEALEIQKLRIYKIGIGCRRIDRRPFCQPLDQS